MKKIAFIIKLFQDSSFHGGGEKLFYKLIDKLIKNNCIIDIYCSKSNVSEYSGINKISVLEKPYDHINPVIMEEFYQEAQNLVKDKNYDFIISENITPPVGITFLQGHSLIHRQKKLKSFLEAFLYNFRPEKKYRIKYQEKWIKHGFKKIFVVSNILKNDIVENFNVPENNISVVYPGVDIPENIPESKIYNESDILTFGLSAPGFKIKGGYVFLKALSILKKKNYQFRAKIIYPKAKKNIWVKFLLKLYGIEKNIEFLSFQKNMQDFYKQVDCIVMPSYEDTFNLVALEALANKKICIASTNCGASEIIEDKKNGFVFSMDKPALNLAEKLMFIIDNKRSINIIEENGFITAQEFSWDKTFNNFAAELEKI